MSGVLQPVVQSTGKGIYGPGRKRGGGRLPQQTVERVVLTERERETAGGRYMTCTVASPDDVRNQVIQSERPASDLLPLPFFLRSMTVFHRYAAMWGGVWVCVQRARVSGNGLRRHIT